ncbi:hypothetical protein [Streptomyces oryzae]|uniref:hypothetical protein n=1 Tax=Streptomyces oryzae TaxID=1434886 RepID=UPI001FFE136D|nr:hypothetical protein [Streptomyces oryzae]
MANQLKPRADKPGTTSGQGLLLLFSAILVVQGFGSAITEAGWDTSFGVAGLLRAAQLPGWTTLLVGAVGVGLLAVAARRRYAGKRSPRSRPADAAGRTAARLPGRARRGTLDCGGTCKP